MRDLALFAGFSILALYALKRPPIAIYLWAWMGYMNPHKLTWSYAYSFPFAQVAFILILVSVLISGRRLRFPLNSLSITWLLLLAFFVLTTTQAIWPEGAWSYLVRVAKIQAGALLAVMLIHSLKELRVLIVVIAISIGFYGIKGGVFTLLTGGAFRVWGPDGTFISDNNALATALLIVLPLFFYLLKITTDKRIRYLLLFSIASISLSILGSWSRGAFVGIAAVFCFLWLKGRRKFLGALLILLASAVAIPLMPDGWIDRMKSIQIYEEDASASARIYSWKLATRIANDRILGGGFAAWGRRTEARYMSTPGSGHVAHSIYFHILGEHGYIGLFLFLMVLYLTWRQCSELIRLGMAHEQLAEYNQLGRALQVSLVAYCTGGAFLSLSYFDLLWNIVGAALIATRQCQEALAPPSKVAPTALTEASNP